MAKKISEFSRGQGVNWKDQIWIIQN
ncbi:hypothetical protein LCGC14_2827750, partial [marine sediment metagenome]